MKQRWWKKTVYDVSYFALNGSAHNIIINMVDLNLKASKRIKDLDLCKNLMLSAVRLKGSWPQGGNNGITF